MTGQYDRIEPLDEQDIIDMRREVTTLREQVRVLTAVATHQFGGPKIVEGLAQVQPEPIFRALHELNRDFT